MTALDLTEREEDGTKRMLSVDIFHSAVCCFTLMERHTRLLAHKLTVAVADNRTLTQRAKDAVEARSSKSINGV